MRVFLLAALCLVASLLTSCYDGKEEFWLNENGSGSLEGTYDIPTTALLLGGGEAELRRSLDTWLKDAPDVRCEKLEITTTGDRTKLHFRIAFTSVMKFIDAAKPEKSKKIAPTFQHLTGLFDVKVTGRDLDFSRTVSPNKAFAGGLFMPKKEIEGRRLLYVMHLPVVPEESNATRTEDGGKTLVWDYALADGLKKPILTHLKAKIPIPTWAIAGAAGLGVVVLLIAYLFIRRFISRRREKTA